MPPTDASALTTPAKRRCLMCNQPTNTGVNVNPTTPSMQPKPNLRPSRGQQRLRTSNVEKRNQRPSRTKTSLLPGAASPTEPKTGPASPAINHESAAGPSRMHAMIHDKSFIFMHHSRTLRSATKRALETGQSPTLSHHSGDKKPKIKHEPASSESSKRKHEPASPPHPATQSPAPEAHPRQGVGYRGSRAIRIRRVKKLSLFFLHCLYVN